MLPFYGAFVNTQMELIKNKAVLARAVQIPGMETHSWAPAGVDPADYLADKLKVDNPLNTELLSVSLRGENPATLAPVVNAVLGAYMEKVRQQDASADLEKLEVLYKKQADLEAELQARHDELYAMASKFGAVSLGNQQDAAVSSTQQIQLELKKAQAARIAAESRLKAIRDQGPSPLSPVELDRLRAEVAATDPELASLTYARQLDEQKLIQGGQQVGPDHREMKAARENIAHIDERIAARQKALGGALAAQADYRAKVAFESTLREAQQAYAVAAQEEKALQDLVKQDLEVMTSMGRNAVQLQALREKADQTKQLYQAVLERIQHLETEKQRPARVSIDSLAVEPTAPARDKRPKLTILSVGVGLFLAILLAVLADARDTSLRNEDDVRRDLGLRLVGTRSFPKKGALSNQAVVASVAEEIRGIRGCVLLAGECQDTRSVLVTSPNPREGKTRMAADLAVATAESGRRVLLVDADNRKRDLTHIFGRENRPGLAELLNDGNDCADFICSTQTADLDFLPSGKECEEFSELLVRPGRMERLRKVFDGYDLVIFDSPPVLLSNEPCILARYTDSVLMVVRARHSARQDAIAAKERLAQMGGHIMGAVLNDVQVKGAYYRRYGAYVHA
jgi:capsular exopolysaccharide synthesis family protein